MVHEISAQLLRAEVWMGSCRLDTSGIGGGDILFLTEVLLLSGDVLKK